MKMVLLRNLILTLLLIVTPRLQAAELKDQTILSQSPKATVLHKKVGSQQFLISQEAKTEKELSRVLVWSGSEEGRLLQGNVLQKSNKVQVLELTGSDGDYSFFEIVAWNPETGALAHLLGGDSFSVLTLLKNETELRVELGQSEDAPDFGRVHFGPKLADKSCSEAFEKIEKLEKEKAAILKKSGSVPKGKNANRIAEITSQIGRVTTTKFVFDLNTFASVKVTCEK